MSRFSVKKPFTIIVAMLLIILLGVVSFLNMSTDLLPSLELPYVVVMTTCPGASPEKVERTVTKPLEQSLATTSGVKNITSVSQENASVVILEFTDGTNMDSAIIEMNGYIDMVKGYFEDTVQNPMLMKLNPDMLPIMIAAVDVEGLDHQQLSRYIQDDIIPAFERVPGVASVTASGLVENRIEVTLNQEKIDKLNEIMVSSVSDKLADAEKELRNAQSEITKGKDEVQSGKDALKDKGGAEVDGLAQLSAQIDSGVASFSAMLAEESVLTAQKAAFTAEKEGLSDAQTGYVQMNTMLGASGLSVDALINMTEIEFAGFIATVPENTPLKTLTQADLIKLREANNMATTRLPQIDIELGNIETKLMTSAGMKATLQQKLTEAQDAYVKMENGKVQMAQGLSSAESSLLIVENELEKAQKSLDDALTDFEKQRDQTLEDSNLDGILTQETISQLLMAQNFSMPAGSIVEGKENYTVKVGDAIKDIDELKKVSLISIDIEGLQNITLQDVADVKQTDNSEQNYTKINGNDGILLNMQKQSTFSTADICKDVKKQIETLESTNENLNVSILMDQGVYIDLVVNSVLSNLIYGGVLAVFVLLLFLKDWRTTLIIGFSIPISVMFAIVLMYFSGITLNIVSLSGLSLGVGMLVDNSIVAIENIYRLYSQGYTKFKAAVAGAKQISGAICASTLTTVCVFLPIVFTQGLTKQIFTDMGLTIAYSLVASLIVALTFVPTMSSLLLKEKNVQINHKLFDKFTNAYTKALDWSLGHKAISLLFVIALFVYSVVSIGFMGTEFMPSMEGTQMTASLTMPKESLKEDLINMSDTVIDRMEEIEDIETVGAIMGSGGMSLGMGAPSSGGNKMDYYILLREKSKLSTSEIAEEIKEKTKDLDCTLSIQTSNMDMSMLGGTGISVNIKGRDLDTLSQVAKDLSAKLQDIEGVDTVTGVTQDAPEETVITVNKVLAAKHGLTVAQVYGEISQALKQENTSTTLSTDIEDFPVIMINSTAKEISRDNIADYEIKLQNNASQSAMAEQDEETKKDSIKLSEIATITQKEGRNTINHDNQSRIHTITVLIAEGHNIGLVGRDVTKVLDEYEVPAGYSIDQTGENETIVDALFNLVLMIALAIVFIYMIMVAQFQSLLSPFIVMFTIPLAFTGGLIALQVCGLNLSVLSMLGFLVLSGVVVNNGIVFIDYTNQLRQSGIDKKSALLQAGRDRIRPILMTAITTILGLSTMAFAVGMGADMMQAMAVVTIGGLMYATVLTLFIVPVLYDMMHKKPIKVIDVGDIGDE